MATQYPFLTRAQVPTPPVGFESIFYDLDNGSVLTSKSASGVFTSLNILPSINSDNIDDALTGFVGKIIVDAGCALNSSKINATEYESIIDDLNFFSTVQLDLSTGGYTHGITSFATLFVATTLTNALCNGSSTGTASTVASGGTAPYTIAYTDLVGTTVNPAALAAGSYIVSVTDANGAVKVKTFVITEPPALTLTVNVQNESSLGTADGIASAVVAGGTPGYTYVWNDSLGTPIGQTTQTATSLAAGTYQVVVTDANGCTISQLTVTIA